MPMLGPRGVVGRLAGGSEGKGTVGGGAGGPRPTTGMPKSSSGMLGRDLTRRLRRQDWRALEGAGTGGPRPGEMSGVEMSASSAASG